MAAERPQRANAGRNMGKLLEQEMEKDEFYTTAYGGFDEASGDDEYEVRVVLQYTYCILNKLIYIYIYIYVCVTVVSYSQTQPFRDESGYGRWALG